MLDIPNTCFQAKHLHVSVEVNDIDPGRETVIDRFVLDVFSEYLQVHRFDLLMY